MTLPRRALLTLILACTVPLAGASEAPRPATVELAAEAQRAAANDLATATAYHEATATTPAAVATQVNRAIAAALETAKAYGDVRVQSGSTQTWPVYARNSRSIEGWRMRSEIRLESRNIAAMSELLGKLQDTLAVSQIAMQPAPETRRQAADEATVEAIRAFEERARLVAGTLGRKYRIAHLSINEGGYHPPPVMARMSAEMAMSAAPAPMEAGESLIGVNINGRIELID